MSYDASNKTNLVQTVAPTALALSLDAAKKHARIDHNNDDTDITTRWLPAAIQWAQERTERQLLTATFRQSLRWFPCDAIYLRRNPVQSVTSVKYIDQTGTLQTWSSSEYQTDTDSFVATVRPLPGYTWPVTQLNRDNAVQVTFIAGEDATADCDPELIQLVALVFAHMYEHREPVITAPTKEIEQTLSAIVGHYRGVCV